MSEPLKGCRCLSCWEPIDGRMIVEARDDMTAVNDAAFIAHARTDVPASPPLRARTAEEGEVMVADEYPSATSMSRYSMLGAEVKIAAMEAEIRRLREENAEHKERYERLWKQATEQATENERLREENAVVRAEAFRANRRADEFMAELRAIAAHVKCAQRVDAVTGAFDALAKRVEELEGLLRAWGTGAPDAETYHRREEAVYAEAVRLAAAGRNA